MWCVQCSVGICLMLGIIGAGIAAETPATPSSPPQQATTPASAQTAEDGCDLPYVMRASDETVTSFKKRLRERQEAIESCQREVAGQEAEVRQ